MSMPRKLNSYIIHALKENLVNTMSKWKILIISLGLVVLFFWVTGLIFPWHLYPMDRGEYHYLTNPVSASFISKQAIYTEAFFGVVPWTMLSPWSLVGLLRCAEAECIFVLIYRVIGLLVLFYFYAAFIFYLIRSYTENKIDLRHRLLARLGVLWFLFLVVGIIYAKQTYVNPPFLLNSYLQQLQQLSNKEPFPPGITVKKTEYRYKIPYPPSQIVSSEGSSSVPFEYHVGRHIRVDVFSLNYNDPTNSKEQYNFQVIFYDNPQNMSCRSVYSQKEQGELRKLAENVWLCDHGLTLASTDQDFRNRYNLPPMDPIRQVSYAAFLDQERKVYAATTKSYPSDQPLSTVIPTFFGYYRGGL